MQLKLISLVSVWEMAIKLSLGKLQLTAPLEQFTNQYLLRGHTRLLSIEPAHLFRYPALPLHHRDPFDRLLIAQALAENIPLISNVEVFDAYGVQRLWD